MNLAQLLANPPVLHVDQAGRATSWKVSDRLLTSLDGLLHEEDRTLETGAGVSTLLFTIRPCYYQAVVPAPDLAQRISDWCGGNGVATDRLEFVLGGRHEDAGRGGHPMRSLALATSRAHRASTSSASSPNPWSFGTTWSATASRAGRGA